MATVGSIAPAVLRFVDQNSNPAVRGRVHTYLAGTTTPAVTYKDATGQVANTNPVLLDERGECVLWFDVDIEYKLAPKLANGTPLRVMDNMSVTGAGSGTALAAALLNDDPEEGSSLVTYSPSWANAIARTIADLFDDQVTVTTFMSAEQRADARSNGGTLDCSDAWQAVLDYASLKGKKVIAPAGSYRLDNPVTVTNADLMIEGHGQEVTKILVNNTTGGIFFTQGARAGTAYMTGCRGMTFVAYGTGDVLRGTALSIIYASPSACPGTPNMVICDVSYRSVGYDSAPGNPRFTGSLYIKDAQCARIERVSSVQLNNSACTGIRLDYSLTNPSFQISVINANLQGGGHGLWATGAVENLHIISGEIASPQYGITVDASGVNHKTPVVTIIGGHVNATNRAYSFINCTSVQVAAPNLAIYTVDGFTVDSNVYGAYFQDCDLIEWTGGIINSAAAGSGTAGTVLMQFSGCADFTVTGLVGRIAYSAVGFQRGIQVDTLSNNGSLVGNRLYSTGGVADSGIFVQTVSGVDDHVIVDDNSCFNFTNGVSLINEFGVKVRSNDFTNCTVPVLITGGRAGNTIIKDNYPANGRVPVGGATFGVGAVPDGRLLVNNASATTLTDITNGYDGMEIDLLFADGNTTVNHTATIFMQGSVPHTFAGSTNLRLKFDAFTGVWWEQGRRT